MSVGQSLWSKVTEIVTAGGGGGSDADDGGGAGMTVEVVGRLPRRQGRIQESHLGGENIFGGSKYFLEEQKLFFIYIYYGPPLHGGAGRWLQRNIIKVINV
ncbi:unnamed protein product [Cuscuta europaea]|uniref:Uncharacterized protein n=1 Tax=Cuscuta europaea TaxID=41803 RepID=A0A9P1EBF2_CUSEU|nr:unnamed protein product [Cuscuta europaea]